MSSSKNTNMFGSNNDDDDFIDITGHFDLDQKPKAVQPKYCVNHATIVKEKAFIYQPNHYAIKFIGKYCACRAI